MCKRPVGKHPDSGTYRIYVLTIWKCEGDSDELRLVLEDPRSGVRMVFTRVASDGANHGAYHGDFGHITHVQAFVAIPAPDSEAWKTEYAQVAVAQ